MRQATHHLTVATRGQGLVIITEPISRWLSTQGVSMGLLTIWCRHTSASLLVQENADPDVCADIETFLRRLVPERAGQYRHDAEGPDDMPAHIRAILTQTQLSVPVEDGTMALGIWQGIYLYEHRSASHRRELVLHLLGD